MVTDPIDLFDDPEEEVEEEEGEEGEPEVCAACGTGEEISAPESFCTGCKHFICDDCCASSFGTRHKPWQHRPCTECGESVADKTAKTCASCEA